MSYTVVCDRIAAAVPATVKLTALEMGSFEERPEKGQTFCQTRGMLLVYVVKQKHHKLSLILLVSIKRWFV